jgi:hypothetical protein
MRINTCYGNLMQYGNAFPGAVAAPGVNFTCASGFNAVRCEVRSRRRGEGQTLLPLMAVAFRCSGTGEWMTSMGSGDPGVSRVRSTVEGTGIEWGQQEQEDRQQAAGPSSANLTHTQPLASVRPGQILVTTPTPKAGSGRGWRGG